MKAKHKVGDLVKVAKIWRSPDHLLFNAYPLEEKSQPVSVLVGEVGLVLKVLGATKNPTRHFYVVLFGTKVAQLNDGYLEPIE